MRDAQRSTETPLQVLEPRLRYSYFKEELQYQREIREQFYKAIDQEYKNSSFQFDPVDRRKTK